MKVQSFIDLLVPMIGVIITVISVSLTYLFTKKQQNEMSERRLKEKYYLNYIEAASNFVISNDIDNARDKLADAQNRLLLVGGSDVVLKLMLFCDYINHDNHNNFDVRKHNELLTDLLKSMRKDLYKKSNVNAGYPMISLIAKARKR